MSVTTETPVVTLTPVAIRQVKRLIAKKGDPNLALRLSVRGGGCSGFSYAMSLEASPRPNDIVNETEGVKVLVDPKSAKFLQGATVDWSMSNLLDGGFKYDNPNATRTCGCGTSFQPKI